MVDVVDGRWLRESNRPLNSFGRILLSRFPKSAHVVVVCGTLCSVNSFVAPFRVAHAPFMQRQRRSTGAEAYG